MAIRDKLTLGVIAACLAGCSSLNPLNWGSDSGPKPAELREFQATVSMQQAWATDIGGESGQGMQPAVVAGRIYVASTLGTVSRINSTNGTLDWRTNLDIRVTGATAADGSTAVVASQEGEVVALDADSGNIRWRARVSSEVLSAPVVTGDLVLVRSSDSRVFALDARDGRRRWVYQRSSASLGIRSSAGLVVAHGHAYAGFSGGKLVAIALSNGGIRWEATVSLPKGTNELDRVTDVVGLPWVGEQEICAVAYQGRIACFAVSNGNLLWSREVSSVNGLDADAGQIYVTDDRNAVQALNRSSGASVWKQDALLRRAVTAPRAWGNQVAVGDGLGYIHLLSRETGAFTGRIATDGTVIGIAPLLVNGQLLVLTRKGRLVLLAR